MLEENICQLLKEKTIHEKERLEIKMRIETFSKSNSEKEKNMVSKLKEQLIVIEQRMEKNIAEIEKTKKLIEKTKEKIMSLQENIKSLKEEMHKDRKEKSR